MRKVTTVACIVFICIICLFVGQYMVINPTASTKQADDGLQQVINDPYLRCRDTLKRELPVDKLGVMKVHHFKAQTGKWNEERRWDPIDIGEDCTIWYIGGNTNGVDGIKLKQLYSCEIRVFEPIPSFVSQLKKNWENIPESTIYDYGLGSRTRQVSGIIPNKQGTFAMTGSNSKVDTVSILVKNVTAVWEELGFETIDLMHVNCEGCEWELLEAMQESSLIQKVKVLQVGTHWFMDIENIEERYCKIETSLTKSHKKAFQQYFGWERWEKK